MAPLGPLAEAEPVPASGAAGAAWAAAVPPDPTPDALSGAGTLEWIERRAWQSLFCLASRECREALGLRCAEQGPLFGGFAPRLDVLALNRVLGLGQPPDSLRILEAALEMARRGGAARILLPVLPGPVGARAGAWLEDRGLAIHNHWVRLSLRLDAPFHAGYPGRRDGRPEVRPLARPEAEAYGVLAAQAFGMPLASALLFAGTVGAPGWVHLGAWWGGEFVGAAALYHEGPAAWLGFGCVREAFRGRGIQTALIGERLRRARDLGCAVASAETGDWTAGRPPASMRNLLRFGFEPRYRRPNYLLTIR